MVNPSFSTSSLGLRSFSLAALLFATATSTSAQSFYGMPCADSAGNLPRISYPVSSWIANPSMADSVQLLGAIPGSSAVLFMGGAPTDRIAIDLSIIGATGCTLSVNPFLQRPAVVAMDGTAESVFSGLPAGFDFVFQWVMVDLAAPRPLGVVTTDALQAGLPTQPGVFRMTDLDLRDPHLSLSVLFGCSDITDTPALGGLVPGFNPSIEDQITMDADGDNNLDLNFNLIFRPFDPNGTGGTLDITQSTCTVASATMPTTCTIPDLQPLARTTYQNGTCLGPVPGTTNGYTPPIATPSGSCFITPPATLSADVGGITFTLENAQIGGEYTATNPPRIINGLIAGFVPESTVNAITIPAAIPILGGSSLSTLINGGMGNCSLIDDKDIGPSGAVGWWVYMNFEAEAVPFN